MWIPASRRHTVAKAADDRLGVAVEADHLFGDVHIGEAAVIGGRCGVIVVSCRAERATGRDG
jgi:hypothetical protein